MTIRASLKIAHAAYRFARRSSWSAELYRMPQFERSLLLSGSWRDFQLVRGLPAFDPPSPSGVVRVA